MIYWKIHVALKGDYFVYLKTQKKYSEKTIVEIAVRQKELLDTFSDYVDCVEEISEEEYFKEMDF